MDKPRKPLSKEAQEARRRPKYFLIPGEQPPPVKSSGKGRVVKVRRAGNPLETK